ALAPSTRRGHVTPCYNRQFMPELVLSILFAMRVFFQDRADVALEVLALRQQLAVLKRKATAASSERPGPALLDYPVALLAPLDGCPRDCQIQDRRRLASGWFPSLLALAFSSARWPAEDHRGDSSLDPPDGGRECRMGCTQDSRRTLEIGSRRLR